MTENIFARPVILVEDNPRDREYLANALSDYATCIVESAELAIAALDRRPESYLVSDLQLPDMSGIDLAKMVWAANADMRIIFWSQYNDEVYLRALSRIVPAQALYGYVLKSNPSATLLKALKSVFDEDQCWIDPQIRPLQARTRLTDNSISDAEYEALVDIALGLTDSLIAERRFLSKRGVQSRLKSLYEKLGLDRASAEDGINPRSRAVVIALNRGLINPFELEKAEQELRGWRSRRQAR